MDTNAQFQNWISEVNNFIGTEVKTKKKDVPKLPSDVSGKTDFC